MGVYTDFGIHPANLVVEGNLPLADYFGTADGRDGDKMDISVAWGPGSVLDVPTLCSSPLSYELEVAQEISLAKRDETVLLCRIRNTLKAEVLTAPGMSPEELLKATAAVRTCHGEEYYAWDGRHMGKWHERSKEIKPNVEIGRAAAGN